MVMVHQAKAVQITIMETKSLFNLLNLFFLFLFFLPDFLSTKVLLFMERGVWRIGSLSTCVFETQTANGREHFACQDNGFSQIFTAVISNGKKILSNVNVVV